MNKVFKIIWNNVTQSFVVVSELARNRGKLSSEMKKSNVVNLFKLSIFTMCMMGALHKYKLNLLLEAFLIQMLTLPLLL
ncbi:ESPR domain-containing protein [Haemophilus parainfluenzae]|uniref:ESPR domain-containing protein n=1 Tax=Haemophilus parainfluenzae TaxID=729 RepID=UPI0009C18BB7